MISWIIANAATLIISAVLIAVVILAVRSIVTKKSTCSCGCGCDACEAGGCPGCAAKK